MTTWTLLANTLLDLVAEGAKLGEFLANFQLTEGDISRPGSHWST